MTADKTNAARTRQNIKKQEKNLAYDEQLDDEVPKINEGAEHCVQCSEEGSEILTMLLWLPKLFLKGIVRQPFICGFCTAEKTLIPERNCQNQNFYLKVLPQSRKLNQPSGTMS